MKRIISLTAAVLALGAGGAGLALADPPPDAGPPPQADQGLANAADNTADNPQPPPAADNGQAQAADNSPGVAPVGPQEPVPQECVEGQDPNVDHCICNPVFMICT